MVTGEVTPTMLLQQKHSNTVYAIYFASLIFRESGLQDIFASG